MDQHSPLIKGMVDSAMPIALADMDNVSLLNRIDKKYVLHIEQLPALLLQVLEHYYVLDIAGNRVFTYRTIYFDTPDFQFYKDHHNGLTNRIKVRCRQYVESNNTFFEIKRKYKGYRTDKYRKGVEEMMSELGDAEYEQIKARYTKHDVGALSVTLHNFFSRMTLVSKKFTERATIDFDLSFRKDGKVAEVNDIVIVEVKQGKCDDQSPMVQALKRAHVYQQSISKYTYGLMLMEKSVKHNAFKRILNKVTKIQTTHGVTR